MLQSSFEIALFMLLLLHSPIRAVKLSVDTKGTFSKVNVSHFDVNASSQFSRERVSRKGPIFRFANTYGKPVCLAAQSAYKHSLVIWNKLKPGEVGEFDANGPGQWTFNLMIFDEDLQNLFSHKAELAISIGVDAASFGIPALHWATISGYAIAAATASLLTGGVLAAALGIAAGGLTYTGIQMAFSEIKHQVGERHYNTKIFQGTYTAMRSEGHVTFVIGAQQGAPLVEVLPDFLRHLQHALEAAGGRLSHLPLGELLHELPLGSERAGGSATRALSRLLTSFIGNSVGQGCGLLVLWGLESCGALDANRLSAALRPLRALPVSCALLGLCTSRSRVTPAVRALFDNADPPSKVLDLGLSLRSRGASTEQVSDARDKKGNTAPPVIGCAQAVAELQAAVVSYYRHTELFKSMGVAWPPRVLVHGPPGSGKTHLLHWLCAQLPLQVQVHWLHPGEVWSRYLGESEEHMRKAFARAAEGAAAGGSILVLEGLDQLAPHRRHAQASEAQDSGGLRDRLAATLLTCLDGIDSAPSVGTAHGPGLGVLASSCVPAEQLDPRVTRPGRMDRWIPLGVPEPNSRVALLQHFIASEGGARFQCDDGNARHLAEPSAEDVRTIERRTEGLCAGQLRLVAAKTWASLSPAQLPPAWSDVITALGPGSLLHRDEPSACTAVKDLPSQKSEPTLPSWRPDLLAQLSEHSAELLDVAVHVALPDSDSDEL